VCVCMCVCMYVCMTNETDRGSDAIELFENVSKTLILCMYT
jgi:hypothetical protein